MKILRHSTASYLDFRLFCRRYRVFQKDHPFAKFYLPTRGGYRVTLGIKRILRVSRLWSFWNFDGQTLFKNVK